MSKAQVQEQNHRRVKGYPYDEVQQRKELILKTYEYDLPFNYPNITVYRKDYDGGEFHGIELINHNDEFPVTRLGRVAADQWVQMRMVVDVPPGAAAAEFVLDVANMASDETLQIADAFAGLLPDDWDEEGDIPADTPNLLENPAFAGDGAPPPAWGLDHRPGGPGRIRPVVSPDADGHAGLLLEGIQLSLHSTVRSLRPGQKMVFTLWAKPSCERPQTVWLFTRFLSAEGVALSSRLPDVIIVEEEEPIVRVAVMGSACTPPGYVMLEAEPCEEFYRRGDFVRGTAPVRYRQDNLWGMHLRWDSYGDPTGHDHGQEPMPEGMIRRYPGLRNCSITSHYRTHPLCGMSCAIFEIPQSRKVTITGGSENDPWLSDGVGPDNHYSFRTIRTTVTA